jgi:molybdopterin-binding protein
MKLSARNQLKGKITDVKKGSITTQLISDERRRAFLPG